MVDSPTDWRSSIGRQVVETFFHLSWTSFKLHHGVSWYVMLSFHSCFIITSAVNQYLLFSAERWQISLECSWMAIIQAINAKSSITRKLILCKWSQLLHNLTIIVRQVIIDLWHALSQCAEANANTASPPPWAAASSGKRPRAFRLYTILWGRLPVPRIWIIITSQYPTISNMGGAAMAALPAGH